MKESSEMISKNILIAEDELITRMDIAEIIKEAQHNVVGEASDGFDCIELCRKHRPDLVIMDIKMPILDGIKASKIIMEENIAGCIVLLTAYNDKEYVEEAKKVGVMNYLIKPIDEKSIIPAIEVALSINEEMRAMKSEVEKLEKKLQLLALNLYLHILHRLSYKENLHLEGFFQLPTFKLNFASKRIKSYL